MTAYPAFIPVAWNDAGQELHYKPLHEVTGAELAKASAVGGEGYGGDLQRTYRASVAAGGRPTDRVGPVLMA